MPKEYLPICVDPIRCIDNATQLRGSYPIKDLARLLPSLFTLEGDVEVELAFGVDGAGIRFLRGHFRTFLILQCQRCLEPFFHAIYGAINMGLVTSEAALKKLPSSYDAMIISEKELALRDFIEEEVIISLPLVPMHEPTECKVKLPLVVAKDEGVESERNNPFSVIAKLKSTFSERK